jgi:hypothetical protein
LESESNSSSSSSFSIDSTVVTDVPFDDFEVVRFCDFEFSSLFCDGSDSSSSSPTLSIKKPLELFFDSD